MKPFQISNILHFLALCPIQFRSPIGLNHDIGNQTSNLRRNQELWVNRFRSVVWRLSGFKETLQQKWEFLRTITRRMNIGPPYDFPRIPGGGQRLEVTINPTFICKFYRPSISNPTATRLRAFSQGPCADTPDLTKYVVCGLIWRRLCGTIAAPLLMPKPHLASKSGIWPLASWASSSATGCNWRT